VRAISEIIRSGEHILAHDSLGFSRLFQYGAVRGSVKSIKTLRRRSARRPEDAAKDRIHVMRRANTETVHGLVPHGKVLSGGFPAVIVTGAA
jgi:hypothetical protein